MEEQLISFETAKLAKEKGFDALCYDAFNSMGNLYSNGWCEYLYDNKVEIPFRSGVLESQDTLAPAQSLLAKWLREKYDIEINVARMPPEVIKSSFNKGNKRIKKYNMWVWSLNGNPRIENPSLFFDNYEEAFEIGLQEALKLINYD